MDNKLVFFCICSKMPFKHILRVAYTAESYSDVTYIANAGWFRKSFACMKHNILDHQSFSFMQLVRYVWYNTIL